MYHLLENIEIKQKKYAIILSLTTFKVATVGPGTFTNTIPPKH